MNEELLSAFKKVEKRLQKQKEDEIKAEARKRFLAVQALEEAARRRQAILVYCALTMFVLGLVWAVQYANKQGYIAKVVQLLTPGAAIQGDATAQKCSDPNVWNTPLCVAFRKDQTEAAWKDIRLQKGQTKGFAVHNK